MASHSCYPNTQVLKTKRHVVRGRTRKLFLEPIWRSQSRAISEAAVGDVQCCWAATSTTAQSLQRLLSSISFLVTSLKIIPFLYTR